MAFCYADLRRFVLLLKLRARAPGLFLCAAAREIRIIESEYDAGLSVISDFRSRFSDNGLWCWEFCVTMLLSIFYGVYYDQEFQAARS